MFMLISNEPMKNCSLSKISQSVSGEWRICDKSGNNSFNKSKENFGHLIKQGTS